VHEQLTHLGLITRLRETPDQARGPQVLVTVVRQAGNDVLVVTVNHMAFDGHGLKSYLYLLSALYSSLPDQARAVTEDISLDRRLSVLLRNVSRRRRFTSLFRRTMAYDGSVGPFTPDRHPASARLGMLTLGGDEYRTIRSYGREHDLTVNDVILALLCRAIFEEDRRDPQMSELTIQVMFDLRRYACRQEVSDYGNFSSMESIRVGGARGTFLELATEVRTQTLAAKEHDPGIKNVLVLDALSRLLPRRAFGRMVSGAIRSLGVSTSNLGVVDESRLVFAGMGIERLALITSLKNEPAMQLTFSTFRDQMTLTVFGKYSVANWAVIERLLARIDKVARGLPDPKEGVAKYSARRESSGQA
jgi:NRPS condensation-like uncharacterized protein